MKHLVLLLSILLFNTFTSFASDIQISGIITDENGEAIPGVMIFEKGNSAHGTTTNFNGEYHFIVDEEAVVVIRYMGYQTEEILAKDVPQSFKLTQEAQQLDAIEIVGTRSQNRTVTESPVAIDVINLENVTAATGQLDMNQLLQYVAPSFNAQRQSGADGSDHVDPATLRGLGPDQTLVLINGKRRHQSSLVNLVGTRGRGNTGTDLNAIPMAAIERIEILRDGASAQYGSDAIAGVINIVLKKNTDGVAVNVGTGVTSEGDGESANVDVNYGTELGKGGFINLTGQYQHRGRTNRMPEEETFRNYIGDALSTGFGGFVNAGLPLSENTEAYVFGGASVRHGESYAWTREADDDRNVPEIYPNGFDPNIISDIADYSVSAGVKTNIKDWKVDFNNTFGYNEFKYSVDQTLNASLGANSPTSFYSGKHYLSQNVTGVDISKYFDGFLNGLNIAFGSEFRIDTYGIGAGEEASYKNYSDGSVPGGAQGFPGFRPENEVNAQRTNVALYLDIETDITDKWMIAVAGRYENYSDFGGTLNGKIASRYEFSKAFAVRGAVSTGFRAPSLAQKHYSSIFTDVVGGVTMEKVITPNDSELAKALGMPELKQEKAFNASLGFTANLLDGLSLTVDGYYVAIDDRIVLTGAFEDTDPEIGDELKELDVSAAQFFTNALDTRTLGLDVVLAYSFDIDAHNFTTSVAGNINRMELGDITTNEKLTGKEDIYFGEREQMFLLASAPNHKFNYTINHSYKKLATMIRLNQFSSVELMDWDGEIDHYAGRLTTDIAITYSFNPKLRWTIGGNNIFNVYPTKQDPLSTETAGYWDPVQMGFNGAYFYTKFGINF
ncbi:TonB-dependent receptor [Flammeovirga yaeyamensis]|uniref:TonB-dependent receptor n=1 Tax=Flammeovirga yaeyamensis TaxID=367791 RepID=A0AAX1MYA9_9BACT|nr:TonB-dependent receptor [Flammeovirga yaeyamensis]MBB3696192.1 iron complex outermembrane receptor protein [Flammeovirga yaeyamensis]NMF34875.1 TonB-dependent receptor [Flammeovirga yaeyamensis]QWG00298.1 TonB-dependent receptor [Flammeovirga yaeyamensis]